MLPGEFGRSCDVVGVTLRRMLSLLRCSGIIAPVDMLLARQNMYQYRCFHGWPVILLAAISQVVLCLHI